MANKRPQNKLHGEGTYPNTYKYTFQLLDQIGPVGRFSENISGIC